jgi:hypothetical protein
MNRTLEFTFVELPNAKLLVECEITVTPTEREDNHPDNPNPLRENVFEVDINVAKLQIGERTDRIVHTPLLRELANQIESFLEDNPEELL